MVTNQVKLYKRYGLAGYPETWVRSTHHAHFHQSISKPASRCYDTCPYGSRPLELFPMHGLPMTSPYPSP
jgi:hypothetical protein